MRHERKRELRSKGERAAVLIVVAVAATIAQSCADPEPDPPTTTVATTTTAAPTSSSTTAVTTSSVAPPTAPPQTAAPATAPPATAVPTDQRGRVLAIVESLDPADRTAVVNVVQYFSGQEYIERIAADPGSWGELGCGPNGDDYDGTQDLATCSTHGQEQVAIDDNPRLRTLSVAADATFEASLDGGGAAQSVSEQQFIAYLRNPRLGNYFWLDIDDDGWIRSFEFQFFS